ncbi:MAG: hypothetical protein R3B09_09785 [Nannocystaceae bacterium]
MHDHIGRITMTSSRELLELYIHDLLTEGGRVHGSLVTVFHTPSGEAVWVGSEAHDDLVTALPDTRRSADRSTALGDPPVTLAACERVMADRGMRPRRVASLVYAIGPATRFPSTLPIARSDDATPRALRAANPGGWHPVEWDELLDGKLGPWTMALEDHAVASICHTPKPMTERTAEAGVWTDPKMRGRGHAAATTAAWAQLLRPSGRALFYSTTAENHSSQRVAARLKLRLLAWRWELAPEGVAADDSIHPLSTLRR